jgi:uncharacterized protein YraI
MIGSKRMAWAAALLLLSTGIAAAVPAQVARDLNVRAGEGTGYPVIATMPAGATVNVTGCGDGWCFVHDYGGYASAAYLEFGGSAYVAPPVYVAPPAAVVVPGPVYRGPHYRDGRRFIRRGIREFRREIRRDARQDRREIRRELRQDRREARQERRPDRREARPDRQQRSVKPGRN